MASRTLLDQRVEKSNEKNFDTKGDYSSLEWPDLGRIARELHESAGQTLAALSINLTRMAELANHSPAEFAEETKTGHELVQQLTQEIRTTSYLLHPPLLDETGTLFCPALVRCKK